MVNDYQENYISGWVRLYRSFVKWEWFEIPNMVTIFIYCLLKANFKDKSWRGITIKKGTFLTSIETISKETNVSTQSVRTCLRRLEETGEINKQSNKQNTIITICKYDDYQKKEEYNNEQSNKQLTNDQQTANKQLTTTNNYNNINKEKKILNAYEKSDFLKDWNQLRTEHLKKPSHLKRIGSYADLEIFNELLKDYREEDFKNAMVGLFKQQVMPNGNTTMQSNPSHFLNYFNSYLTAYHDRNRNLYGKPKKETA